MARGGLCADFGGGSDQEEREEQGSEEACTHETPQFGFRGISMLPCGLWDLHDNSRLFAGALVTILEVEIAPKSTSTVRPAAVRTISMVLFLATTMSFLTGISLLFPNVGWHRLWELNRPAYAFLAQNHLQATAGALLLALGIATAMAGAGLLRDRRWAWWIAVAVFATNGLGDLLTMVVRRDVVKGGSGVLIASVFLYLLMHSGTRGYFGKCALDMKPR